MSLNEAINKHYSVINNNKLITVNFSLPSNEARLCVYDYVTQSCVKTMRVAHGAGSSDPDNRAMAINFDNKPNSHKSSLGSFVTDGMYVGKHGKSIKLIGLDKGINDNAYRRGIVIHAADYVTDKYIQDNGRAGESWGCFAVSPLDIQYLLDNCAQGVLLYAYVE